MNRKRSVEDTETKTIDFDDGITCYFKIAERDLLASNVLFRNKLYAHAAFFIQQSIEKSLICLALLIDAINKKDLKQKYKRGHDLMLFYEDQLKLILDKIEQVIKLLSFSNNESFRKLQIQKNYRKLQKLLSVIKNIRAAKEQFFFVKTAEIDRYLNEINENMLFLKEISTYKISGKNFWSSVHKFKSKFQSLVQGDGRAKEEIELAFNMVYTNKKLIEKIFLNKQVILLWSNAITLFNVYFLLSIIILPHAKYSRYPNKDLSPLVYNKRLPFVRRVPRILKLQQNLLGKINVMITAKRRLINFIVNKKHLTNYFLTDKKGKGV